MRLFQNKNDLLAFRWYFDKYGDAVEVLVTVLWVIGFHVSNEARNSWTLTEKAIWAQIGRQIETERGGKKNRPLNYCWFSVLFHPQRGETQLLRQIANIDNVELERIIIVALFSPCLLLVQTWFNPDGLITFWFLTTRVLPLSGSICRS